MSRLSSCWLRLAAGLCLVLLSSAVQAQISVNVSPSGSPGPIQGTGFGQIAPLHNATIAIHSTNGPFYGMISGSPSTMWTWAPSMGTTSDVTISGTIREDEMGALNVTGMWMNGMMMMPPFTVHVANVTFPCKTLTCDPMNPMSCMGGGGSMCDPVIEGQLSVAPGQTVATTIRVCNGLPGTLTVTAGSTQIELLDANGATLGPLPLGAGVQSVSIQVRARNTFTGGDQLTARFLHASGGSSATDILNLVQGTPPPTVTIAQIKDIDSDPEGTEPDDTPPLQKYVGNGVILQAIPAPAGGTFSPAVIWTLTAKPSTSILDDTMPLGTGDTTSFTPDAEGAYTITATSGSSSLSIDVETVPVQIQLGNSFGVAWEGTNLKFVLSATSNAGRIATYDVDIDADGTFDVTTVHDPLIESGLISAASTSLLGDPVDNEQYEGVVRVRDERGNTEEFPLPIVVANAAPTISVTGPHEVQPNEAFTLAVDTSDTGPDTVSQIAVAGPAITNTVQQGSAGTFSFMLSTIGDYKFTVTVTDEDGSYSIDHIVSVVEDATTPAPIGAAAGAAPPNVNTYEPNFRAATPDLPPATSADPNIEGWEVHHTKQQALAARYAALDPPVNVHEPQHLRGAPVSVHREISDAQRKWRIDAQKRLNIQPAMFWEQVPLSEAEEFEQKLEKEYSKWWIKAGNKQKAKINSINKSIASARGKFVIGKAGRMKSLGFAVAAFGIFTLVTENAKAAANIANHTPEQLGQWNNFVEVYEVRLEIAITTPNAFTKNQALILKDAFISYVKSFPGQDGAADKLSLAIDKEITLSNLPD